MAVIIERTEECDCCLHKKPVPKDHKETPEEKKARLEYNKKAVIIWYVMYKDGKVSKETGEPSYRYNKKKYHLDCLLAKLRRDLKKDEDKIQATLKKIEDARQKSIYNSRKKGLLKSSEMKTAKGTREGRERLTNYLMGHYAVSNLGKKIHTTIKNLDEGKSTDFDNVVVNYEKLLDMFIFYEKDLAHIAENKRKKGQSFVNESQHILYDISVIMANLDNYNNREVVMHSKATSQQDERGEILDVKKYRQNLQNRDGEEDSNLFNEAIKRANEFADEYTKEYDGDKYDMFEGLFDDMED